MGRQPDEEYVGRAEAAKLLELSLGGLDLLVKRGTLIPQYRTKPRGQFFRLADLQAVRTARGGKDTDFRQVKALALMALSAARRAEARLDEIFAAMGIDVQPLPRDEASVRGLYEEMQQDPTLKDLHTPERLRYWGGCFFGMDEVYLELVTQVTGDDEPWKVFMDFGSRVARLLLEEDVPALYLAAKFFQGGRAHVRYVGYMHCRNRKGQDLAEQVFGENKGAVNELYHLLH